MFKTSKSRLMAAALAMLVCVAMFVGSTFAWFTDSVSSVNNIIKSGNLDITVEYKTADMADWAELTADAPIFDAEDLWEPGHTVVGALRIKNVGSLAAKIDIATNVVSEETSINVYGNEFKLSDYLDVYTGTAIATDRTLTGMTATEFGATMFTDGELEPGQSTEVALAIVMPTTVGNEANHKTGENAPKITFGITVNATQMMFEEDSFGNDYDEDATYPEVSDIASIDDLVAVLENGGNATLSADIDMATAATRNERITIPEGETVILDLAGNTITSKDGGNDNTMAIYVSRGATLILNDSVGGGEIVSSCYGVYVMPGANFIMNGGTITVSGNATYDIGVLVYNGSFVMNNGTINARYGVWADNYWRNNGETAAPNCAITIADNCEINATYTDVDYYDAQDAELDIPSDLVTYPAA